MSAMRQRVIEEAMSWEGTPFHDCAGVKGAGVDCAHLLKCVAVTVGLVADFTIAPYRPQWFLHHDEPLFLQALAQYADQIDKAAALPADIAMYNFGKHAAHGAFIIDENTIIHAFKYSKNVTLADRRQFRSFEHSFWRIRGIT